MFNKTPVIFSDKKQNRKLIAVTAIKLCNELMISKSMVSIDSSIIILNAMFIVQTNRLVNRVGLIKSLSTAAKLTNLEKNEIRCKMLGNGNFVKKSRYHSNKTPNFWDNIRMFP